ncbi:MAG: DUF1385 domain-containing protein [Clostridiales bacterium]|mgnify:CR=1 FL=1|nr:DUF1385 domain-containing protein [Clostridiales bacterium]
MRSIEANREQRQPDIGGQAVLDGVMMKAPDAIAVAVRRENGDILVKRTPYTSPIKKGSWLGKPFIRGSVNMWLMMKLGMGVLQEAARMTGALESEQPSRFEAWLSRKLGKGADKVMMGLAALLAVALSAGLFMLLPNLPARAMRNAGWSLLMVNLVSGLIRILILMAYLFLVGLMPDMRRTFQYHGAEHKAVYAHEAGLPLTPANAQTFTTLHPRCGTSFLLLTFILSILFYSVMDQLILSLFGLDLGANYLARILTRLLFLPVVAGLGYEALKALARANSPVTRALRWPGMQLQRLTTRPPTDAMLEVSIAALNAALHGLPEGEATPEGYVLLSAPQPKPA